MTKIIGSENLSHDVSRWGSFQILTASWPWLPVGYNGATLRGNLV